LPHHFPEEELAVEGWEGWGGFGKCGVLLDCGFVEGFPERGFVEVGVEAGEPRRA